MDIQSLSSDQINFFKFSHSSQYNSSINDNENITSWKLSCIMDDLQEYQVECNNYLNYLRVAKIIILN